MKIRNGFVSNSSTSSFVIIGFEFELQDLQEIAVQLVGDEKVAEAKEQSWYDEEESLSSLIQNNTAYDIVSTYMTEGKPIIGITPLSIDENTITLGNIDLQEIIDKTNKLKEILKTNTPVKIIGGNYLC